MSADPENNPELICLNQPFDAIKDALVETVFKELMKRMQDLTPFKMEIVYKPDMTCSVFGDWAAVKFTPPKDPVATKEKKS